MADVQNGTNEFDSIPHHVPKSPSLLAITAAGRNRRGDIQQAASA
jgi:hypothetical protein